MIVECPNCKTTFNVDDDLVPEAGIKSRCSVCEHVFAIKPGGPAAPAAPDADDFGDDDFGIGDELGAMDAADDDDDAPPRRERPSRRDAADDDDDVGLGFDLDGGSSKKEKKSGGGKGKKVLVALVVLLLLIGGAGAGLWFFAPDLIPFGLGPTTMAGDDAGENGPVAEEDQAPDAAVRDIVLDKVRQYYVDNDKLGRIFVIEGVAVNGFDAPKELITVRARLLDDTEQVLDSKELMAGNTLSLFQLQVFDKPDFDQALADKTGIASRNTNVAPGGEVPFMVVFFEPPDAVREFVVDVVSVVDPPKG